MKTKVFDYSQNRGSKQMILPKQGEMFSDYRSRVKSEAADKKEFGQRTIYLENKILEFNERMQETRGVLYGLVKQRSDDGKNEISADKNRVVIAKSMRNEIKRKYKAIIHRIKKNDFLRGYLRENLIRNFSNSAKLIFRISERLSMENLTEEDRQEITYALDQHKKRFDYQIGKFVVLSEFTRRIYKNVKSEVINKEEKVISAKSEEKLSKATQNAFHLTPKYFDHLKYSTSKSKSLSSIEMTLLLLGSEEEKLKSSSHDEEEKEEVKDFSNILKHQSPEIGVQLKGSTSSSNTGLWNATSSSYYSDSNTPTSLRSSGRDFREDENLHKIFSDFKLGDESQGLHKDSPKQEKAESEGNKMPKDKREFSPKEDKKDECDY